ncbi:MAG TPA: thrombospondin type 3 repeat-containing protein [Verrucomicrobiae bacterium]|nr:thrombospondin type 3 repeat-containing protein [Verrucomicrobiae bacterium]
MKSHIIYALRLTAFIALAGSLFNLPALAAPNIYTNTSSGRWEVSSNWSLGAPGATDSSFITNPAATTPITVSIDATTSSSFTNTMTVANLTISSPANSYTNTLFLNNAGTTTPLHVISNLTILPGGALTIFGSALKVDNGTTPTTTDTGSEVELDGNNVLAVNSTMDTSHAMYTTVGGHIFGGGGPGNLSMSNCTFTPHNFYVGYQFNGTATFENCSNVFGYGLTMGGSVLAVGNMFFNGGTWIATNTYVGPDSPLINLGVNGTGNLTISNASVQLGATAIGNSGAGSLIVQSNVVITLGKTFLALDDPNSSGIFSIDGAQVSMPELHIVQGAGTVNMANGTLSVPMVSIGETNTATGALNITGGTTLISTSLTVGSNALASASVSVFGGALYITNDTHTAATIMNGGSLFLGTGVFQADNFILTNGGSVIAISNFLVGATTGTTNTLDLSGGSRLILTNAALGLGNNGTTNDAGTGIASITDATIDVTTLNLGSPAGGLGFLTLQSNALLNVQSNLTVVSGSLVATSSITFSGGSFTATNGLTQIGSSGNGLLTISGGNHMFRQIMLGSTNGLGSGGFHFLGGHVTLLGTGTGPGQGLDSNWILWEGGDLDGSGTCLTIANGDDSNVLIPAYAFNVRGQLDSMYVGYSAGNIGTFTQAASSSVVIITDQMILGGEDCVNGAQGNVILSGGTLYVTNATHTANLEVRNGTFTLGTGATLVVDNLILNNACGHFVKQPGGILITNNAPQLSPDLDADGDGQSNGSEALAGTDPLNPSSTFQMTSVVRTNGDSIRVDWTTVGGHSYVVQTNGNLGSGTFHDLSAPIVVPGTAEGTTNYVHTDGATDRAKFYRVRLGP